MRVPTTISDGDYDLDWHCISYTEITWPPGVHRALLKHYGAKGSSLLVVSFDGDIVVEGSGAIIDLVETKAQDRTQILNPEQKTWLRLEK